MNLNLQNKDILRVDYVQQNPVSKHSPLLLRKGHLQPQTSTNSKPEKCQVLQYKNPRCV